MSKCINCKYYMEITYATKESTTKSYCLKLVDTVSTNIPIIDCNQFVSKLDLKNNKPVKT